MWWVCGRTLTAFRADVSRWHAGESCSFASQLKGQSTALICLWVNHEAVSGSGSSPSWNQFSKCKNWLGFLNNCNNICWTNVWSDKGAWMLWGRGRHKLPENGENGKDKEVISIWFGSCAWVWASERQGWVVRIGHVLANHLGDSLSNPTNQLRDGPCGPNWKVAYTALSISERSAQQALTFVGHCLSLARRKAKQAALPLVGACLIPTVKRGSGVAREGGRNGSSAERRELWKKR